MSSRRIIVLDAGTSRARCHLFHADGRVMASASREWQFITASEPYALAREWQPAQLWQTFCDLIAECAASASASSAEIAALAVTSQRQAIVCLDRAGNAIYASPNLDLRALFEGGLLDERHADRIYATTGHLPSFLFAPAKLRWLQANRPRDYARVAYALPLADWLTYRLTGVIASEPTLAVGAGLLDIHSRRRCDPLLSDLGITLAPVPLHNAAAVVGEVSAVAARDTTLPTGIPVVAAGADTQCGLLGMGIHNPAEVGIIAGWSAPVQMITAQPILPADRGVWASCYLAPDRWVAETSAGDAGNAYAWLASILFGDAPDRFERMSRLAQASEPGADGAMAFLSGNNTSPTAPGLAAGGFVFPVPLTLSPLGRASLARAALESIAYKLAACVERLESAAGLDTATIALGGGMTRAKPFAAILAAALGKPLSLSPMPDATAAGARLCAATAIGEYTSLDEAARFAKQSQQVIAPDAYDSAAYRDLYRRWQETAQRLQSVNL